MIHNTAWFEIARNRELEFINYMTKSRMPLKETAAETETQRVSERETPQTANKSKKQTKL